MRFPEAGLAGLYGEAFFETGCLTAVLLTENSGSVSHTVEQVTQQSVTIRRSVPEEGTCDMAALLILIETDRETHSGDVPEIILIP